MGDKRDAYVEKMKAKLDELNAEIDKFQAGADQAKGDVQVGLRRLVGDIKSKRYLLGKKIEELQKAGEGAWEDVKSGVDIARKALDEAIETAKSRFN